jgi:hypothetical protein
VRAIAQSGLAPTNCRLLDPGEAMTSGAGDGSAAILVIGFESADHRPDAWMARALELCRAHGGQVPPGAGETRDDESGARECGRRVAQGVPRGPYLRDAIAAMGMICETFEAAITGTNFPSHAEVMAATGRGAPGVRCGSGGFRFTHLRRPGAVLLGDRAEQARLAARAVGRRSRPRRRRRCCASAARSRTTMRSARPTGLSRDSAPDGYARLAATKLARPARHLGWRPHLGGRRFEDPRAAQPAEQRSGAPSGRPTGRRGPLVESAEFQQRDRGLFVYPRSGWRRLLMRAPLTWWRLGLEPLLRRFHFIVVITRGRATEQARHARHSVLDGPLHRARLGTTHAVVPQPARDPAVTGTAYLGETRSHVR